MHEYDIKYNQNAITEEEEEEDRKYTNQLNQEEK